MTASGRFLAIIFFILFFLSASLNFLNFYNEHDLLGEKKKFTLLKKHPKILRVEFGHECGLAFFQADNGFLCYPFQVQFAFPPGSDCWGSKESVMKGFRALSKPRRPRSIVCLPWGHIAVKSSWPWQAFVRIKLRASEVAFILLWNAVSSPATWD